MVVLHRPEPGPGQPVPHDDRVRRLHRRRAGRHLPGARRRPPTTTSPTRSSNGSARCSRASAADPTFGNGRYSRNVLEAAIGQHAWRLRDIEEPTVAELRTLAPDDLVYVSVDDTVDGAVNGAVNGPTEGPLVIDPETPLPPAPTRPSPDPLVEEGRSLSRNLRPPSPGRGGDPMTQATRAPRRQGAKAPKERRRPPRRSSARPHRLRPPPRPRLVRRPRHRPRGRGRQDAGGPGAAHAQPPASRRRSRCAWCSVP